VMWIIDNPRLQRHKVRCVLM